MSAEDLRDTPLLRVLRDYWWVVVASVVAFAFVGGLANALIPNYEASVTLLLSDPQQSRVFEQSADTADEDFIRDQMSVVESRLVAEAANRTLSDAELGHDLTVADIEDATSVRPGDSPRVIQIRFSASSHDLASAGVEAVVAAYRGVRLTAAREPLQKAIVELDAAIADLDEELVDLEEQIAELVGQSPIVPQLQAAFDRLAALEDAEAGASGEDLVQVRNDIANQLLTIQVLQSSLENELAHPDLARLSRLRSEIGDRRAARIQLRDEFITDADLIESGVTQLTAPRVTPVFGGLLGVIVVSGVVGLVFGLGIVSLMGVRVVRVTSPLDAEPLLDAPLLAAIPHVPDLENESVLPIRDDPGSAVSEALRFAATAVLAGFGPESHHPPRAELVVFLSAGTDDERSFITANVGSVAATDGRRVLLIDADFKTQRLTQLLIDNEYVADGDRPLEPIDEGSGGVSREIIRHEITVPGAKCLDLVTAGGAPWTRSALALLDVEAAKTFLDDVRLEYDLIFIDGPPATTAAHAAMLATYADRTVVVVRRDTLNSALAELRRRLSILGVKTVGYIYSHRPRWMWLGRLR